MRRDPAVVRVKHLRPLYNYEVPVVRAKCIYCRRTCTSIIEAWCHSLLHGPWAPTPDGTYTYLADQTLTARIRHNVGRK